MLKQPLIVPKDVIRFPLQASREVTPEDEHSILLLEFKSRHPQVDAAATNFITSIRSSRPKMIVFDKDGTLGDCTASLRKWVLHMTDKVRSVLLAVDDADGIIQEFHQQIGWDAAQDNVVPSAPVAAGTWEDIVALVYQFLLGYAPHCNQPVTLELAQKWHVELGDLHGQDTPLLDDLREMMIRCQQLGYIIGICTSDDRGATDVALRSWNINDVVAVSVCGNEVAEGKPSAVPLQVLCQRANQQLHRTQGSPLTPRDCIMVGDTTADTGMARAAQAGLCVGVLTGSGTTEQLLDTGAHLILPHVGHIPELLETLERLASKQQETQ